MHSKNPIASLLGSSPFKPLQEHMRIIRECVIEVPVLFDALAQGNAEAVGVQRDKIFAKEAEADRLKQQLSAHLPKSLFMPVDRRDLLDLLGVQDSIANIAQDIAGLLTERRMTLPEGMEDGVQAFVSRSVDACTHAATIVEELDELLASGFRGREAGRVGEMIAELHRIENHTDEMGVALARQLFAMEDEMKPVSVMFWYQLLHWIGDLADAAEKVGDRMELLLAR
ncbi:MAG: TIGR00153 family protein [Gammaproteobacteria bacterium SHHR-1]|uniref:TIGR00153 family protein n=1 Tax=Magnetovirga frankeli TaxID=947516 RepID=UPI001293EB0F|nr:TIGR00153 family protein [gamma proteobacterium SS-5]